MIMYQSPPQRFKDQLLNLVSVYTIVNSTVSMVHSGRLPFQFTGESNLLSYRERLQSQPFMEPRYDMKSLAVEVSSGFLPA